MFGEADHREYECPPATKDVKTYDVIEKDGWVYVTL